MKLNLLEIDGGRGSADWPYGEGGCLSGLELGGTLIVCFSFGSPSRECADSAFPLAHQAGARNLEIWKIQREFWDSWFFSVKFTCRFSLLGMRNPSSSLLLAECAGWISLMWSTQIALNWSKPFTGPSFGAPTENSYVTKDYFGVLNYDSLRKNFVLVYELLDEMIVSLVYLFYSNYFNLKFLHW